MPEPSPYLIFTTRFEAAGVRYAVGGGVAAIFYGEPRLTLDLDVLLELRTGEVDRLLEVFPESEFYVPPADSIRVEIARGYRGHMNLYHHATGYRADVYIAGRDWLDSWSLENIVRMPIEGGSIALVPPEAVIIRKLEYFREGGSEKHVRDIQTILANQDLLTHRERMETWIVERGLENAWRRTLENFQA